MNITGLSAAGYYRHSEPLPGQPHRRITEPKNENRKKPIQFGGRPTTNTNLGEHSNNDFAAIVPVISGQIGGRETSIER
jgi:hypothetical protein